MDLPGYIASLLIGISLGLIGGGGSILLGSYLNRKIPAFKLKKAFGWFVLAMGLYILVRELSAAL